MFSHKSEQIVVEKTRRPKGKWIILTVPHATCKPETIQRTCDRLALPMAKRLYQALPLSTSQHSVMMVYPLIPRSVVDMNRPASRKTEYREYLRKSVFTKDYDVVHHFDIHSYPKDGKRLAELVYILDDRETASQRNLVLAKALTEALDSKVGIFKGPQRAVEFEKLNPPEGSHNDIQDEFLHHGIESTLIEFLEEMTTAQMETCVATIVKWCDSIS